MNRPDLRTPWLRTTALRLAVGYVLGYAVLLGLLLAAVSWSSTLYVDARATGRLRAERDTLTEIAVRDPEALAEAVRNRARGAVNDGRFYVLVTADGKKLAGNLRDWPTEEPIAIDGKVHSVWIEEEVLPGKLFDDDALLPAVASEFPDGRRLLLALGVRQAKTLQSITDYLGDGLGVAVLLALAMGITLSFAIRRRIDTINTAAMEIVAGALSRRVPLSHRNDEFDALATHLNAMLDRIQQLVRGMREVTDNIAHDLRSPLTRLRSRMEVTLLEPRDGNEYRHALAQGIEDAESLIRTFNALLEIAQAEAGHLNGNAESLDLSALAHDVVELYAPLAEASWQLLQLNADVGAKVEGSRKLLAQAIGNLIENAIKYAPAGSTIGIRVRRVTDAIELSVADCGPGIPESERERVLERFVRLDTSRHTPGNGLGLSLVRAVATLHKAQLVLADARPGLLVTLRFPGHPQGWSE